MKKTNYAVSLPRAGFHLYYVRFLREKDQSRNNENSKKGKPNLQLYVVAVER